MSATEPHPHVSDHTSRPIPASIAVLLHQGRVLLVRRANRPDAGRWGFPGGKIEAGETIKAAAVRELAEETGVCAEARGIITALDVFDHDASGRLRQHFVLVAVLCQWLSGEPAVADDALEARWFGLEELADEALALSLDVARVARQAAIIAYGCAP